jgi:hypothetical protein
MSYVDVIRQEFECELITASGLAVKHLTFNYDFFLKKGQS